MTALLPLARLAGEGMDLCRRQEQAWPHGHSGPQQGPAPSLAADLFTKKVPLDPHYRKMFAGLLTVYALLGVEAINGGATAGDHRLSVLA